MNKNTHIFICSASRSCMIAVAETVGSYSKSRSSASSAHGRIPRCRKTSESSALYLSNKPVAHVICAQAAPEVIATDFTFDASVGVSYSVMTQSVGFSASASKGQGKSDGQDTSYTNTTIAAGNIATIKSGSDTTLKGAVVTANTIKADAGQQSGGSLSIENLQDQSSYTSQQTSSGGSISVGGGAVTGGSISASKSNINSTFSSVNQQSGLKAGDGGFQVTVANNTDLKGGAITSTQKAVDDKTNSFSTGGQLTATDVQNTASYKGTASGISIDVGKQDGKFGVAGVGIGAGSDKGSATSTTAAGITGIAGNKDARTGDLDTGLQKIFDQTKVQKKIDAEVAITQAFTKQVGPTATKGIISLLDSMATPASAPTAANPTPAADKIIKSDQDTRAGFNAIQADPKLDAPAKAFFADLSNAYIDSPIQSLVNEAKADPQGYQQRMPPMNDSIVKDKADDPALQQVVLPLLLGPAAPAGATATAAGATDPWRTMLLSAGITYDPITETYRSKSDGTISSAAFLDFMERGLEKASPLLRFINIFTGDAKDKATGGKSGVPLAPPAPVTTPNSSPPDTNATTTPADQPRPVVTTGGSQIASPMPGGNSTVSPILTPQGPGIVMSNGYQIKPTDSNASDWRTGVDQAFDKPGMPPRGEFLPTKWARDKDGKSFIVEWTHPTGAEVNIDVGHKNPDAPSTDHIGWQTGGKRNVGGKVVGHIFVPDVPINRSPVK